MPEPLIAMLGRKDELFAGSENYVSPAALRRALTSLEPGSVEESADPAELDPDKSKAWPAGDRPASLIRDARKADACDRAICPVAAVLGPEGLCYGPLASRVPASGLGSPFIGSYARPGSGPHVVEEVAANKTDQSLYRMPWFRCGLPQGASRPVTRIGPALPLSRATTPLAR